MVDQEIVIKRKEGADLHYKSTLYYNLKHIKTLPPDIRDDLLLIVKKINMSAGFRFDWGSSIIMIIIVHFCLFIGNFIALLFKKEIINNPSTAIILKYFCKYLLTNSLLLLFWLFIYFGIVKPSTSSNIAVYRLSSFILGMENYHNTKFKYQFISNMSIKVTPVKLLKLNDKRQTIASLDLIQLYSNSPIEYVINSKLIFYDQRYLGNKLYEKEDIAIIKRFDDYFQEEIKKNANAFFKECIVPTIIAWLINIVKSKEKYIIYPNEVFIISGVLIIFIWMIRIQRIRELAVRLRKYMNDLNMELILKGKFIYRNKALLSLFALTPKGRLYDVNEMNQYIQKIINTKIDPVSV